MFSKIKSFLMTHVLIILCSLCVGVVYIFPHLYFSYNLGSEYQGVYMSGSYDEDYYNAITRQVYDGVLVTANPHLAGHDEKSISTLYNFQEYIVGLFGKIFGMSITTLALFSKFVFPTLLFFVIYFFIFALTKSKSAGILTSLAVLFAEELAPLNIHSAIQTFLFNSPFHNFLFFNRPINPQVSAIFFFLALFAFLRLWQNQTSKKWAIISGITVGILPYIYFYFWTFSMIFVGAVFLYALIYRNKNLIKNVGISIVTSLVLASPFIFQAVSLLGNGGASVGKNYVLTHRFIVEKVVLVPLLFLLAVYLWNYLASKRKKGYPVFTFLQDTKFYFVSLLLISGLIASNQQVIHGFEIQQHHYHFMTNIPIFIISGALLLFAFLEKYLSKYKKYSVAILIGIVTLHAVSVQASSYSYWKPIFTEYQKYAPAFLWLQENTKMGETVFANNVLSELIPVYTHDNVYGSLHASVYPVPLERLRHNYFMTMYLRGVREKNVKEYMYKEENRNELGQYVFEGQYWRAVCGSFGCFPDETLNELIDQYKIFLQSDFGTNLKKYPVQFVMWDKKIDATWKLGSYSFLKPVFETKNSALFKVE